MEPSETPTLDDLARLLETAAGGDRHAGARETARWLIEETAGELYAELVAKSGEEPSPMELARLECAVTGDSAMPEVLDTAYWLVAQSEPAREHLARLDQLEADGGNTTFRHSRTARLEYEHYLDRLLERTDDWQDPNDAIDPTREEGIDLKLLYNLCRARIGRSRGEERQRLEEVRDKLERPVELERLRPMFNRRFERLRDWLAELDDPESAAESLEEMGRLLRSALGSPAEE